MKFFFLLFLVFILFQTSPAQTSDFYDKVLSLEFIDNMYSPFIVVDVVALDYEGKAIIENRYLYPLLNEKKGFTEKEYQEYMKDILLNKKKLLLCNIKIKDEDFLKVKDIKNISEIAIKGKEEFLKHFFDGKDMFVIENTDELGAVVMNLFDWKIATYIDDSSGSLALKNFRDK